MAGNGGTRPGAGRKTKAGKYSGQVVAAENRISDRLPELIDNLFDLAGGVTVQEGMPNGGTRVYSRAPDFKANAYLIDRIMGKIPDRIAGVQGEPVVITIVEAVRPRGAEED